MDHSLKLVRQIRNSGLCCFWDRLRFVFISPLIGLLGVLFIGAPRLSAQGSIEAVLSTPGFTGYVNGGTIGWAFSPAQDIVIDSLGFLNGARIRMDSANYVSIGLWTTEGVLLRSSVIGSNSPAYNGSIYQPIVPVFVSGGSLLIIGAGSPNTAIFIAPTPFYLSSSISFAGTAFKYTDGFTFPTLQPLGDPRDYLTPGATFLFQPVPEPASVSLMGVGAAAFCLHRTRKRLP